MAKILIFLCLVFVISKAIADSTYNTECTKIDSDVKINCGESLIKNVEIFLFNENDTKNCESCVNCMASSVSLDEKNLAIFCKALKNCTLNVNHLLNLDQFRFTKIFYECQSHNGCS